jgi:enoyl-CoA hydratase/carnithine racemase
MEATAAPVSVVAEDGVALVTLNRPKRLNAVDGAMRDALIALLPELDRDPAVAAIVITGAGERAFSAGQDLAETAGMAPADLPRWLNHQKAMYQAVRDLTKGCVAAWNGVAAGGGFQIGLCCDLRIGHPGIRIGQPEVKAGLASIVGSYLMSLHVGLGINRRLSLTGELIDGARAYEVGLLDHLVPQDEVVPRALEEARKLAAIPHSALRLTKERFRQQTQAGFDEACNAVIRYHLENYASGEPQAAQKAFLAKSRHGPE